MSRVTLVCTASTRFSGAGTKYDHILRIFSDFQDSGGGQRDTKGGYLYFQGGSDPTMPLTVHNNDILKSSHITDHR